MTYSCGNCKHWERQSDKLGVCDGVDYDQTEGATFEISIHVLDDSGLEVRLITGRDFGCNHFISRDVK